MSSTYYLLNAENKVAKEIVLPESESQNEPEPENIAGFDPINQLPDNPITEPEGLLSPTNSDNPEPIGE